MIDLGQAKNDKIIRTTVIDKFEIKSKYPLVTLGDIIELNPSKTEIHDIPDDTIVSFIEMASVSNDGFISNKVDRKLGDIRSGGYTYFSENDIIIAKITPCMENGKCAIATGLTNNIALGSSEFHVFRCSDKIINSFLFLLLNMKAVRNAAILNMTGASGHRRVPDSFYRSLQIPLPPLDIQQKIVDECKKVDEKYLESKRQIEKLVNQIDKIYKDSIKTNTKVVKLSDICNMRAGKFVAAADIKDVADEKFKYPCYGGNGMRGYTDTMTNEGEYTIIGRQGALCGNVCTAKGQFHATEHAVVVYPYPDTDPVWLRYHLEKMNLNQYATGTAQPGLSVQKILELQCSIPLFETQKKVAEAIKKCELDIQEVEEYCRSSYSRKQAILDKYLK